MNYQMNMEGSYNNSEDLSANSSYKNRSTDNCNLVVNFERLRVSALTKAAEISPLIKEVTIGPNSPVKNDTYVNNHTVKNHVSNVDEVEILSERKVSEEQPHSIIMKEYETRLQQSAEDLFKYFVEKMIVNREKYFNKQNKELENKARKLQMLKELQHNDNLSILEKAKMDEKNNHITNKHTIENMNRILEEQNRATARFALVTDSHTRICICYNEIKNMMPNEPEANTVWGKYEESINVILYNMDLIMDTSKTGSITDKEVKQAEDLSLNIENLRKKMLNEINMRQLELIKQQDEEEAARRKELEEKKTQEAKVAEIAQIEKDNADKASETRPLFYSDKNYSYFIDMKNALEQYENQYKDLLEDVNLKKFKFDCQKAVNTPVNAISSVSGLHMRDKFDKLSKLLRGERVQVLDTYVTATQHPQGLYYCTALLARKIVRQGDLLVSSNPEAAFPLAAITVALWSQFPEFGKLVEAYFHRECPYLVPMFLPQKEGQTDKEFYLSRGYTYNNEGVVEKHDKFLKRMSGVFRLCCAIWIAKTPRFINIPNPHGLRCGWQWLASFINLKPEPDICATLLHDFFTVCGSELFRCYKKQFIKIMRLINTKYFAILQNIDEGGPKTRLEVFLQNILKEGAIPPPDGLLPPNTW